MPIRLAVSRPSASHKAAAPFELAGLAIKTTLPGRVANLRYALSRPLDKLSRVNECINILGLNICTISPLLKVAGTAERCSLALNFPGAWAPSWLLRGPCPLVIPKWFKTPTCVAIVMTTVSGTLQMARNMLLT